MRVSLHKIWRRNKMAIKIRPYNLGSKSANLLRNALSQLMGRKVWMSINNNYLQRHQVINWGSGDFVIGTNVVNPSHNVNLAINKLHCFRTINGDLCPEWTTDREAARVWIQQGHKVYCRTLLSSREGHGIVVANTEAELVDAPLYTKRFKHSREYRVHVAFGHVIQVVQKRKRNGAVNANPLIRANNDWVFARNLDQPLDSPEINKVKDAALLAVTQLGLDFGACDVLYSQKQQKAVVLECNTAPGLDKTSANLYATAFHNQLNRGIINHRNGGLR